MYLNGMVKNIFVLLFMLCALSCLFVVSGSASVIAPEECDYNVNCEDLGYEGYSLKIDAPPWSGTHIIDGVGSITIEMINDTHFNFTTIGILINAAVVKGGDGANVYNYSGPSYRQTVSSDTVLGTRLNPTNGKFYDISHIDFCYAITPPPTTVPTPPPVPEFPKFMVPVFVIFSMIGCAGILSLVKNQ